MKTLQLEDAKAHFTSVLKEAEDGNDAAITSGEKKRTIAVIIPYEKWKKTQKRQLGTLEDKMSASFRDDFKMTDEELVNLRISQ